ncbi:MAG: hypothetical protein KDB53_06165 [Planctomycetes bacterium]|nr:hypothetical protein [Planctomycetota bacterium]
MRKFIALMLVCVGASSACVNLVLLVFEGPDQVLAGARFELTIGGDGDPGPGGLSVTEEVGAVLQIPDGVPLLTAAPNDW